MLVDAYYIAVFEEEKKILFGKAPSENGWEITQKVRIHLISAAPDIHSSPKVFIYEGASLEGGKARVFAERKMNVPKGAFSFFETKKRDLDK